MNRIILCDAYERDRAKLKKLVCEHAPVDVIPEVAEYGSAEEVLEAYEDVAQADLCFIEINLLKMNGMELSYELRRRGYKGEIVFATSSREYALESYDVDALQYVLKPYNARKIANVWRKYEKKHSKEVEEVCLMLKAGGVYRRIHLSEIEYIESRNTVLYLHLTTGEVIRQYGKLGDFEENLDAGNFLRCHQSYLVNLDQVRAVENCFIMKSGDEVLIRQKELRKMKEIYIHYAVNAAAGRDLRL